MFDLNERLLHLAHSLEGVRTELNGCTERFYYGSPQGQEKFFFGSPRAWRNHICLKAPPPLPISP